MVRQIEREHKRQFSLNMEKLTEKLKGIEPLSLLAWLSYHCTAHDGSGVCEDEAMLLHHHIELIQAIIISIPPTERCISDFYIAKSVNDIAELTRTLYDNFSLMRLRSGSLVADKPKEKYILESIRLQTTTIRNWAFPEQAIEIARKITNRIDHKNSIRCEYSISGVVHILNELVRIIENRSTVYSRKVKQWHSEQTKHEIVKTYIECNPSCKRSIDEIQKALDGVSCADEVRQILLSHSDLALPEIFKFTIDEILELAPCNIGKVNLIEIIEKISLGFGDLEDQNKEHFFMGNPIWRKPFIKTTQSDYYLLLPNLIFHSILDIVELLMAESEELLEAYHDARSKFLEDEVEVLFRNAFSGSEVYRGVQWGDKRKSFENDLIVGFGKYLLIVEAKSGKITEPTKRGAVKRLDREFRELIEEPCFQAYRLISELKSKNGIIEAYSNNKIIQINSNGKQIIPISVTLETVGRFSVSLSDSVEANILDRKVLGAISISIADLQSVISIFQHSIEILHYLLTRTHFQNKFKYIADELDLLALYLETGLNIDENRYRGKVISFYGKSRKLDEYFLKYYRGKNPKKPKPNRTVWWQEVLHACVLGKGNDSDEIALRLLDVNLNDQKSFEIMVSESIADVLVHGNDSKINIALLGNRSKNRKNYLSAYVYRELSVKQRNANIQRVFSLVLESEPNLEDLLLVGIDVLSSRTPYDIICILRKKHKL